MSTIKDSSDMKKIRATWLAGKLGMNFAKAHAIVHNLRKPTPEEKKKISEVLRKEARAPIYLKHNK